MTTTDGRRYAGAAADERRDRRRAEFVTAGLELFGSEGFANVSIKRLCDHSGLTQRYFYESFDDRSALLAAVYDDCVEFARTATLRAAAEFVAPDGGEGVRTTDVPEAARASLGAFIHTLAANPHRARVMLVEMVGVNADLERQRLAAIHGWADLILTVVLGEQEPRRGQRLAAIGLVGAVTQLLVDWYTSTSGHFAAEDESTAADLFELDDILDTCVELFVAAHGPLLT
ncbi:TetR/AcrR family transcriptional regulator [Gordonia rhizosphera]|uniref:Putative TetR family transcriptional regulator n=1 Tax=Gordonia rhizosphera NBRC 16068 TaxID=1108045 RepID=K6WG82_9ACTN|nr:TetR/AcrR family transcriptional regulator [Gordonia rhizosphera]GAB92776.1 putative TetR family transcriptional regulator [Gordonia rhizosphera NBRC 16068]